MWRWLVHAREYEKMELTKEGSSTAGSYSKGGGNVENVMKDILEKRQLPTMSVGGHNLFSPLT